MIGRRCKCSNVLSRPVLIARDLLSKPKTFLDSYFSQVIYCGGYSGEDPPLPIPNREVKLTSADGTATPSGRVGSCRFSESPMIEISSGFLRLYSSYSLRKEIPGAISPGLYTILIRYYNSDLILYLLRSLELLEIISPINPERNSITPNITARSER